MKISRWGGGAFVVALLAAWIIPAQGRAAKSDIRISVALLEVHGRGETLETTAREIRETLARELGNTEGFKGVAPLEGGKETTAEPLTIPALQRAARTANAAYVVYGSLTQLGGTYSFDGRLYDPELGQARAAFFREGAGREDLVAKLGDLASEIRGILVRSSPAQPGEQADDTDGGQVSEEEADSSSEEADSASEDPEEANQERSNPLGLRVRNNKQPIAITSDTLEAINRANTVVFRGNVVAKQSGLRIYCDVMTVFYSEDGKGILKIVADRHVRIIQEPEAQAGGSSEAIVANCDRGVYFNEEGKIVLTGDPVVERGKDTVKGDQITVFLDDNRFTVRQAKVIISPEGMQALDRNEDGTAVEQNEGD
jgi:lipopolysaccharide export system protein LptA